MIRAQVFKSLAGAQKRAAFETAHSKHTDYAVAWCDEHGQPLPPGITPSSTTPPCSKGG